MSERVFFFGEDSHLAREIADRLEAFPDLYTVVNSYKCAAVATRRVFSDRSRIPEIDAADAVGVSAVLRQTRPSIVFNCAGLVGSRPCRDHELEAHYANTETAATVSRIVAEETSAKLVHFGTTASYVSSQPITEDTPPQLLQTAYSLTKLMGEQMVARVMPSERLLSLRPAFVYGGLHDHASVIVALVKRHFQRDVSPVRYNLDLVEVKAPIHVDDFVTAVVALLDAQATGTYVVGHANDAWVYAQVLRYLLKLGIPDTGVTWVKAEDSLGRHIPDNSKLLRTIGADAWPQIPLKEGIDRVVQEYRALYE